MTFSRFTDAEAVAASRAITTGERHRVFHTGFDWLVARVGSTEERDAWARGYVTHITLAPPMTTEVR